MKRLFSINLDVTDYVLSNDVERLANLVAEKSEMAKTASVHSVDERDMLDRENVALILFHPSLGELKKFACDTAGITEINLGLLDSEKDNLPEEIIKISANNLGYVATNLGIDIPENLQKYQTGEWIDPHIDITHLNKVAFYQKLQDNQSEKSEIKEEIEKVAKDNFDRSVFSNEIEANIRARINLTHDDQAIELYEDMLDKYANYTPEKIYEILTLADDYAKMAKAVQRKIIKTAEAATFGIKKESWYSKNIDSLQSREMPYLSSIEKKALFGDEGEDIFNSLPKPIKDLLFKEVEKQ